MPRTPFLGAAAMMRRAVPPTWAPLQLGTAAPAPPKATADGMSRSPLRAAKNCGRPSLPSAASRHHWVPKSIAKTSGAAMLAIEQPLEQAAPLLLLVGLVRQRALGLLALAVVGQRGLELEQRVGALALGAQLQAAGDVVQRAHLAVARLGAQDGGEGLARVAKAALGHGLAAELHRRRRRVRRQRQRRRQRRELRR